MLKVLDQNNLVVIRALSHVNPARSKYYVIKKKQKNLLLFSVSNYAAVAD